MHSSSRRRVHEIGGVGVFSSLGAEVGGFEGQPAGVVRLITIDNTRLTQVGRAENAARASNLGGTIVAFNLFNKCRRTGFIVYRKPLVDPVALADVRLVRRVHAQCVDLNRYTCCFNTCGQYCCTRHGWEREQTRFQAST